tara:strand:+ start:380 stop:1633 length:1254 start_codon:yes stop_codon:yes gene_type:complete
MSSILTNQGAIVALQTLKSINSGLNKAQSEISTGKAIGSAKDDAAIWAISKTMEADVSAFKAVSTSLNTAKATVETARSAAEQITEKLKGIKDKVVTAQSASSSDRVKLQDDIELMSKQIESIVNAAQFNGVNLIDGTSTATYDMVSSLDRVGSTVNVSKIQVDRQDLSMAGAVAATFGGTAVTDTSIINNGGTAAGTADTVGGGSVQTIKIASVGSGYSYRLTLDDSANQNVLGSRTFDYVAKPSDSTSDIANALGQALQNNLMANGITQYSVTRVGDEIRLTNNFAAGVGNDIDVTAVTATGGTPASGGGMADLAGFDVTSDAGAADALTKVEGLLSTAIDAAAALGSAQNRIETQNDFVGTLTDLMKTGIGSLVDADMEEASARLQALQTQQQLGIQALSIANQAPSSILALFR